MLANVTKAMEGFMVIMTAFLAYDNWHSGCGLAWLCAASGWLALFFRRD
jgi:hypothetical protein